MIYPIRTIVAGVADLDGRDPLLAAAAALAERTGATLHLVHAFELPDPAWDAYARMGYADVEALRRFTAGVQARLEERAREAAGGGRVRCHALPGPAAAMIDAVALEEGADLVVVGATRHGTLARTILGTTAQRVLRAAPAPVLVLRGELPARPRRVLLGTDLSPFAGGIHEIALDVLDTLFEGHEAELRSLLVLGHPVELPPPLTGEELRAAGLGRLDAFLGARRRRARGVEGRVRFGDPAKEVVAESVEWGADLVVLGTHGRTGPARWLLGSVAEAAVRGTEVSVLVIPALLEARRRLPVPRREGVDLAATTSRGSG